MRIVNTCFLITHHPLMNEKRYCVLDSDSTRKNVCIRHLEHYILVTIGIAHIFTYDDDDHSSREHLINTLY